jgi:VIT1/CCC1 family predicted Fe2+/Mn2+ transporter
MSCLQSFATLYSVTDRQRFLLQRIQPAMIGLIDGSLSTLAPIFSVAIVSHNPHFAFVAGLATSIGAGISMAFSEGLSDTGELTGRGSAFTRGTITGVGTFIGGILHTLPFLIPHYHAALITAACVVGFELVALAWIRWRFFETSFVKSLGYVSLAGVVIAVVGAAIGAGV